MKWIYNYFVIHFKAGTIDRSCLDDLTFKYLNESKSGDLIRPFVEEEVKQTLWDCDNFKSFNLDEINFNFIKDL